MNAYGAIFLTILVRLQDSLAVTRLGVLINKSLSALLRHSLTIHHNHTPSIWPDVFNPGYPFFQCGIARKIIRSESEMIKFQSIFLFSIFIELGHTVKFNAVNFGSVV